jgi:hypothetical protein
LQNILFMRVIYRLITLSLFVLIGTLSLTSLVAAQSPAPEEASKLLPNKLGDFKANSPAARLENQSADKIGRFGVTSAATRSYQSKNGEIVSAALVVTRSESSAYALLTNMGCSGVQSESNATLAALGTKNCVFPAKVLFARGPIFVELEFKKGDPLMPEALKSFARVLAPTLDKGGDDVPVLVKHLPNWETVRQQASYAVSLQGLKGLLPQPILDSVSFEGGAEAVVAKYDSGTLVVIEFNTARIAGDNDWNIRTKLNEPHSPDKPVGIARPTAYRRVGNYSVFVFDAPSEQAANQLIDQVKYQQVVQWLGENPYLYENAQREFVETTLGVFVAVVKGSGLALVACFGIGGFFGALLFVRRRSQQRAVEAYSDAGGMVRLNLDEITPRADPGRLLGGGN